MTINFKELREQLTDEQIKSLLLQFNVEPEEETADYIVFPTCCHNLEGGSPKLYYYKDSKMFHCYTECNSNFDIFDLLRKMYALRGQEISHFDAIKLCGLQIDDELLNNNVYFSKEEYEQNQDMLRSIQINNSCNEASNSQPIELKVYDKEVLRHFSFNYLGLLPWIEEGIGIEELQKLNIKYSPDKNAIIIPNFNIKGELIGIRARFLNPKDIQKGKYRPFYWNHTLYNHPTGTVFYGIYENHLNIARKQMAIIFEGEKSVLKYGTIYGADNNIALATLGQNITRQHINELQDLQVRNVILAYDSDYEDYNQLKEVEKKYREKAKILSPYFNTYYLMDYNFILPYKSSPIDEGKEAFEQILANCKGVQ